MRQEFEAFLPSLGLALLFWFSYLLPSFTAYKEGLIILNLVSHCKDETRPSAKPHMSEALRIPLLFFMWRWKKRFESEDSMLRCFILAGLHSRAVLTFNFLVTSYRDVLLYSFCGSAPSVDQQNPWVFLRGYNQSQWGLKSYLKAHPRKHSGPNSWDCWQDSIICKLLQTGHLFPIGFCLAARFHLLQWESLHRWFVPCKLAKRRLHQQDGSQTFTCSPHGSNSPPYFWYFVG